MARKVTFALSPKSVETALNEIKAYRNRLQTKCVSFVSTLARRGIRVANQTVGQEYGSKITFTYDTEPTMYGCRGIMMATQTGLIRRQWRTINNATGVVTVDVSPLLMAEFGSGVKASDASHRDNADWTSIAHAGRGTFPGQTHAFDDGGWYWQDLNYEWHHSDGEAPTMPMWHAYEEMFNVVAKTAKEVFGR